jgi:hypothetical protein
MSVRRALTAIVLAIATLAYGGAPASAVPETIRETVTRPTPLELALERRVRERELALTAVLDAAERHARVERVRSDRLAALGYTGNLPKLDVILPIHDFHLSAGFGLTGPHWETVHTGLDFGAATGTELVAVADGTVTEVANAGAYGIRTILTLEDGTEVWYCHQLTPLVFQDQSVEIGEPIGLVGSRERWRLTLGPVRSDLPLRGWIFLAWADRLESVRVPGPDRLVRLGANRGARLPLTHPASLVELAALPGWELRRPRGWDSLVPAAERLLETVAD